MEDSIPDITWNNRISSEKGVPSRCPFATVESCPRFYQSLSLLGKAGSTPIDPRENKRLNKYWEKSDLWPKTDEQFTSISGPQNNPKVFSNFCPEVAHDRFGYFSSELVRYSDLVIQEKVQEKLGLERSNSKDWRWHWAFISPMHHTECPFHSILQHRSQISSNSTKELWYKQPIGMLVLGILIAVVAGIIIELLF